MLLFPFPGAFWFPATPAHHSLHKQNPGTLLKHHRGEFVFTAILHFQNNQYMIATVLRGNQLKRVSVFLLHFKSTRFIASKTSVCERTQQCPVGITGNKLPSPASSQVFPLYLLKWNLDLKKKKTPDRFKATIALLHRFCCTRNYFSRRGWGDPYKPKYTAVMGNDEGKWFQRKSITIPSRWPNKRANAIAVSQKKSEVTESSINVQILTCSPPKGRGTEIAPVTESFINH